MEPDEDRDAETARLEDYKLYCTVRQIADRIVSIVAEHGIEYYDRRLTRNFADPYIRTRSGLFLEFYYGAVRTLWTPWGVWDFITCVIGMTTNEGVRVRLNEGILHLLSAKLYSDIRQESGDTWGPVYAIKTFGDLSLSPAEQLFGKVDRRKLVEAWQRLSRQYMEEQQL